MIEGCSLLSTFDLCVGYAKPNGEHLVLFRNLHLELREGKLVCLMGPNGVGKSSLLRTLAGLHQPLSGTIRYQNQPAPIERSVAVVLTERPRSALLRVEDLVSMGRYPYLNYWVHLSPHDKEVIRHAMAITQTINLRNRHVDELSDGQYQMVMIARALAQETPVILLDEPTAHLDLNNRVGIMNVLRQVARAGKAVLVATHELDLALQTADEIWLTGFEKNIILGVPEDLVLDGVFDAVFQFKGFDLKSGRVTHPSWRRLSIHLVGEGPEYLWTKNALERSGYRVTDSGHLTIRVVKNKDDNLWIAEPDKNFYTLRDLLVFLEHVEGSRKTG
jgi:iron complex transport system ATP-binding protein